MWFLLSFLTAATAAGNDIFFSRSKLKQIPALTKAFATAIASLPVLWIVLWIAGIPTIQPQFWWLVSLEAILMSIAHILYMRALALGPLSQTQPILALTTVFLVITNPLMTNDRITVAGIIGVILVGIGIYATQHPGTDANGKPAGFLSPFVEMWRQPGVMSKLGVAVIYSITSNIDRLALEASSGPFYLAVYSVLLSIILGALMIFRRRKTPASSAATPVSKELLGDMALGGTIHASSILFHVAALQFAAVPYVIAVKRLSIFMTSLWDYFIRKGRKPNWYRLAGITMVMGGILLIVLLGK